jgi:ribonuclease T2
MSKFVNKTLTAGCAILSLALLVCPGCRNPDTQARGDKGPASQADSQSPLQTRATAEGQPYDFYLLNLSWSPEFCATHDGSPECASHPGFVVHGLWPQSNDGSYPQYCGRRPGPTSDSVWAGLMPTASLAMHEWQTHGACTPYDADTYFGLIRRAFGEVHIPPALTNTTQQTMEPPAAIIDSFAQNNAGFPSGSIALSCGNNYLTAIEVCFDKSLNPIACSNVRTCRANVVKIPPQNSAQ